MSGEIIAVGGSWVGWEWYALQRHATSKARIGLLAMGPSELHVFSEENTFFDRMSKRDCRASSFRNSESSKEWIRSQDIIVLSVSSADDLELWQEADVLGPLREHWRDGGVLLAEGDAAGLLFSEGIDSGGNVFRGTEFLQGSFCPRYEEHEHYFVQAVHQEEASSGWGAEQYSGVHFQGRHLWRSVCRDETSRVFHVHKDGPKELDATWIPS